MNYPISNYTKIFIGIDAELRKIILLKLLVSAPKTILHELDISLYGRHGVSLRKSRPVNSSNFLGIQVKMLYKVEES